MTHRTLPNLNFVRKINFLSVAVLLLLLVVDCIQAERIDANDEEVDRFCYPAAHRNTRLSCECHNVSAAPWGMRALNIDCSYKDFKAEDLSEVLPVYIDKLALSWNALNRVPIFTSDSLRQLNLMHNNISVILSNNFARLGSLRELYLGWNSIRQVESNSFASLPHLQILDLSHNNLHVLPNQIFGPLLVLASLELSWNRQFNQSTTELYSNFGINPKLDTLRLDACNLNELKLPQSAPLRELSLRRNLFVRVPTQLPSQLERLDISENLMEHLLPADTLKLNRLHELLVEDMPELQSIGAHSLAPLERIESLSFQNSRRLGHIDGEAFYPMDSSNSSQPPLRTLIFRGTLLRNFNVTLLPAFSQLTELDLNGVPLYCDCQLVWIKDLAIQTNGRCLRPARVRGMLISSVRHDEFSCDRWPRWAYGLIILGLIALCAAGVYVIVMGLRPHRGVTMRRKVGAGSPYARVTIEPNRQENIH